jgi:tryprostatin B 6-hydroxylase
MSRRYGDFVRVAPNELLVTALDGINKVLGSDTACSKKNSGMYDFLDYKGEFNLSAIVDDDMHEPRRRIWDQSLSYRALQGYDEAMREVLQDWLEVLKSASDDGRALNVSLYSMLIPFDSMGKVGFSKDFHGVSQGKENHMLRLLEAVFKAVGYLGEVTWPFGIGKGLGLDRDMVEFEELAVQLTDERDKVSQSSVTSSKTY